MRKQSAIGHGHYTSHNRHSPNHVTAQWLSTPDCPQAIKHLLDPLSNLTNKCREIPLSLLTDHKELVVEAVARRCTRRCAHNHVVVKGNVQEQPVCKQGVEHKRRW